MGICGSTNAEDKVGATHTVGSTSPSDVTVDVNDNDETVVYADTVRLVSTQMLRRLAAAVTGDSAFDQLAVMSTGKDVTGFHLVASEQWTAYFRSVWDTKQADSAADAKLDAAGRFGALLNAVESGAAYRKPGPSIASQSAALQLLSAALAAQHTLLCLSQTAPLRALFRSARRFASPHPSSPPPLVRLFVAPLSGSPSSALVRSSVRPFARPSARSPVRCRVLFAGEL